MIKRIQLTLNDDAWKIVEDNLKEASANFKVGNITISDVVNEMVLCSKIDIKALQTKRTNLRKSLRVLASQRNIDLETVIKNLTDLKNKSSKRVNKLPEGDLNNV